VRVEQQNRNDHADLVLTNGRIYTLDKSRPWISGLAIRSGVILDTAENDADLKKWIGPKTRQIDLKTRFAMPGFNDAHLHLIDAGLSKLKVDVRNKRSIADFQQTIANSLADVRPGDWVVGDGWDQSHWAEKRFPVREELDQISTTHPMYFSRVCGHVAVVNSRALELAGISLDTLDPSNGRIERDPTTGQPTGILTAASATQMVFRHVPPFSSEQREIALRMAVEEALRHGVTSVQDNSVQDLEPDDNWGWNNFLIMHRACQEGKLKIRITEWLPFGASVGDLEEMRRFGETAARSPAGNVLLKTGMLKGFLDGSLGSRSASLFHPYCDHSETSGHLRYDPAALLAMALERDKAGFQIGFHAIGDRAVSCALDTFTQVQSVNGPRDRRSRIEHSQVVAAEDMQRFSDLGVIASMQPAMWIDDRSWAADRLGVERVKGAYAWSNLIDSGATVAFGTDYPVESINPLRGIYACLLKACADEGSNAQNVGAALFHWLAYSTKNPAYAQYDDQHKGSLSPGMLADLVVYPCGLDEVSLGDLLQLPVMMTIVDGEVVYEQTA
jgi:predicted amidohydrolase YtcJ